MVLNGFEVFFSKLVVSLVAAIVILLIGLVIGRFLGNVVRRILRELELSKILKEERVKFPLEEVLSNGVKYIIYFIAVVLALNQVGLTSAIINILLGIIFVLIIIFIVLAFKDFIPNVMAGFFSHQRRDIKEGDSIKVKNIEGKIIGINLVETKIKTKGGDTIYVPNSFLTKNDVKKRKV